MLSEGFREVPPEFHILNVFEHEFDGLNDSLSIISLDLTVVELLHIIVLLACESQHLGLIPRSFVLDHSESAHYINWSAFIDVQAILLIVAFDKVKNPSKHWLVLYFSKNTYEILLSYRKTGV